VQVRDAFGISGRAALAPAALARLDDAAPLVRGMAVWALSRLLAPAEFERLRSRRLPTERDPEVAAEWAAGGSGPG